MTNIGSQEVGDRVKGLRELLVWNTDTAVFERAVVECVDVLVSADEGHIDKSRTGGGYRQGVRPEEY